MRAIIVDDERKSRETLQTLIEKYCDGVLIVGLANGVENALTLIQSQQPDVIFLDISMPDGSGFDLLRRVPKVDFEVIFVTAYDNYALQAIKTNALDYILKPISIDDLQAAIQKAFARLKEKSTEGNIKFLLEQLDTKVGKTGKIAIPASDGFNFVNLDDIICLSAEGSYTKIALIGGKVILSTRHLKEYEDQLPPSDFIRVHHSHIVNIGHITHYHRGEGGYVTMVNGTEITISKRKKKDFLDRF